MDTQKQEQTREQLIAQATKLSNLGDRERMVGCQKEADRYYDRAEAIWESLKPA